MHKAYSARERVVRSLYRQPVDRVPVDYLANAGIDRRLKEHFALASDADEALLQALQVDFRQLHLPYTGKILHQPRPERRVDPQWGIVCRWVEHESGGYWDYCDFPLQELGLEQVESWPMPSADDYDYSALQDQAHAWKDLALYFGNPGLGDILNTTGMMCSMEGVYIALAEEDEAWLRLVDRRLAIQLEGMERSLEALKGRIDFIWMGEDLGTQIGPLISKEMFRRIIRPRHQKFIDLAAVYDVPVMMHSCGSSSWAFDDFSEMGIVAVDTLQPEAALMAPRYLKTKYGNRLAFHGGFSTAGSVVSGSVGDTLKELEALLAIMMEGGGYLFSPTHLLQDNSWVENVLAVYQALPTMGRYQK
ncbi:MAG: uroporphyrinogen decarboxylase family protein [Sphaerochaeta sp.]|nr:uroporphyrinogen decarboxylase family protein [Sphaerochaeta sp.]